MDDKEGITVPMKLLLIVWQRLVTADGETCERCGNTYLEMLRAIERLRTQLLPQRIEPVLRTEIITERQFETNLLVSNQILIAGKPIEKWLGADVGSSPCCAACDDDHCRTLVVGDTVYETIPEELIYAAGLKAAEFL